jgi:hypothetical protein
MQYWKAPQEIHDKVLALVAANHPDLALVCDEIVVIFREKAGRNGELPVLGTARKIGALVNALAGEDYKFMLELGNDTWENDLTSRQQEALLDHLLTACRCEEDPKSGNLRLGVAKPDIQAFSENIERYGMWHPKPKPPEGEDEKGPDDKTAAETVEEAIVGD